MKFNKLKNILLSLFIVGQIGSMNGMQSSGGIIQDPVETFDMHEGFVVTHSDGSSSNRPIEKYEPGEVHFPSNSKINMEELFPGEVAQDHEWYKFQETQDGRFLDPAQKFPTETHLAGNSEGNKGGFGTRESHSKFVAPRMQPGHSHNDLKKPFQVLFEDPIRKVKKFFGVHKKTKRLEKEAREREAQQEKERIARENAQRLAEQQQKDKDLEEQRKRDAAAEVEERAAQKRKHDELEIARKQRNDERKQKLALQATQQTQYYQGLKGVQDAYYKAALEKSKHKTAVLTKKVSGRKAGTSRIVVPPKKPVTGRSGKVSSHQNVSTTSKENVQKKDETKIEEILDNKDKPVVEDHVHQDETLVEDDDEGPVKEPDNKKAKTKESTGKKVLKGVSAAGDIASGARAFLQLFSGSSGHGSSSYNSFPTSYTLPPICGTYFETAETRDDHSDGGHYEETRGREFVDAFGAGPPPPPTIATTMQHEEEDFADMDEVTFGEDQHSGMPDISEDIGTEGWQYTTFDPGTIGIEINRVNDQIIQLKEQYQTTTLAQDAEGYCATVKAFNDLAEIFNRDNHPKEATILMSLVGGTLDAGEMFYTDLKENPAGFLKDVAVAGGLSLAIGFTGPIGGGIFLTARAISAFTQGSAIWNQLSTIPADQRLRELTKIVVYGSIQNFCVKQGVKYTPQIGGFVANAVKGILKNKIFATSFIDGIKTNLELVNKFGPKVTKKTLLSLKNNPSLIEKGKDIFSSTNKVAEEIQKAKISRHAAFRQAKRDANIPVSQKPVKVKKTKMRTAEYAGGHVVKDKYGKPIETREYFFKNKDGNVIIIQDHGAGHLLGGEGPHFNIRPENDPRTGLVKGTKKHYPFG